MSVKVSKLTAVSTDCALRLRALIDFKDGAIERVAHDEWLFEGPGECAKINCFARLRSGMNRFCRVIKQLFLPQGKTLIVVSMLNFNKNVYSF